MDLTLLFGFLVLSALLSIIPGPSVILATGRAITQGSRAAVWIVFGNALGGLVLLLLVIVGLGAVIAASAALFTVVKVLGAIYLLWLGLCALWSARRSSIELDGVASGQHSRGRLLRQGFFVGVSNPPAEPDQDGAGGARPRDDQPCRQARVPALNRVGVARSPDC